MTQLRPISVIILFLIFITSGLSAQRTVEAKGKDGNTYSFKVYKDRGDELNRHSVSLHLIGDESSCIALGYRGTYKHFIWSTEIGMIPTIDDEKFNYISVEGCAFLFRQFPQKKIVFTASDLGDGRYGEVRQVTLPVFAARVVGLHFGVRQVNLLTESFDLPSDSYGRYPINSLLTPEIALGYYGHLARYVKISSIRGSNKPIQRTIFFAAKLDLLLYPALTFPHGDYYPDKLAEKDSVLNYKRGFRLQLEGRISPLKQYDWGFSWRAGVIRSALVDSMIRNYLFYVSIGTYIGWSEGARKRSQQEPANDKY